MKKPIKVVILWLTLLFFISFLLFMGGSFFLYKVVAEEQPGLNLTYLQAMAMIVTRNSEGDSEKHIKESYLREDYQHVSIYYEEDFIDLLPIAKETLDLAFTKTEALFGTTSQEPIDFLVFQDSEEMAKLSEMEGGAGFYSEEDKMLAIHYLDKDLIIKREKYPLYMFQGIILHEYTHYAFARKAKDLSFYPLWFQEGVAVYTENEGQGAPSPESKSIPFAQLTTHEQWERARYIESTNNYAQSYYAIEFLINEFGEKVISDIMNSANKTKDFGESFKEITGLTIHELDSAYLKSYNE